MSNVERETADAAHGHHMGRGVKTGRAYVSGPGFTDQLVEYVVTPEGVCLWGGCIDIGDCAAVEAATAAREASLSALSTTGGAASPGDGEQLGVGLPTTSQFLWTDMVVPFTIAAGVPNTQRVTDAVAHIHANTGMRLVPRTTQANYVEIISNGAAGWSSSAIGMRGGRQVIRLADGHPWPILVHEFLHAFGVYHEQSRSDRDSYVEIKWDNIQDDAVGNFQKQPSSVDYYDYDYGSLMHYPRTSFAKDSSKPTIVPKQSGVTIGQRNGLSFGDRQTIAKMYERFRAKGYAGVWRAGAGAYGLWANASWASFKAKWEQWSGQGLRLHDIHVRTSGRNTYYSGVFRPGSGAHGLWANVDWSSFRDKWQQWSGQGLRLVDMNIHRVGGQTRYSGVFQQGGGGYGLWVNADWTSFRNKWQEWSGQGLRLVDIDVARVGGDTRYSGVFMAGSGGHALWANATWSSFVAKWSELSGQGLRLVDLNVHDDGSTLRYSGCFLPGTDAHYLWANVTWEGFRAKWEELAGKGMRLIDFEMAIPAGGLADVADPSLSDSAAEGAETLEPFGGFFDGGEAPAAPEIPWQEDHGGLVAAEDAGPAATGLGEGGAQFGVAPVAYPNGEAARHEALAAAGEGGVSLGGAAVH